MMRTLCLQAPSFDGFDGGAGARYQARREIRSFWYPTWLAHPAALIPGSKLVDAPPDDLNVADVLRRELARPSWRRDGIGLWRLRTRGLCGHPHKSISGSLESADWRNGDGENVGGHSKTQGGSRRKGNRVHDR